MKIGRYSLGIEQRIVFTSFDAIKIAVFSESFGGPLPMAEDQIFFILDWEVERYRSSVLNG